MIKLLIYRFWPVLLPIILYLVWHELRKKKAKKQGQPPAEIHEGPWLAALLASLVIAIGCVLWFALTTESHNNVSYHPAYIEDGKIIRGYTKPRENNDSNE